MTRIYRRPDKPGGTYYLDYFVDGRRVRRSLETTVLKEAKEHRDALLTERAELRWGKRDRDISPADFWTCDEKDPTKDTGAYIEWALLHKAKSTIARERIDWRSFLAFLNPSTLGAVTPMDVERFKAHLGKSQAARTVNDACVRIGALYSHAKKLHLYGRRNPFEGFRRLPTDTKAVRFLSREQVDALLVEAEKYGPEIHLFVSLGVFAGLRANEAANAKWSWVDLDRGTLTVQGDSGAFRTKSRKARTIPLNSRLRAILEQYGPQAADAYLINPAKQEPGKWRIRYEGKKALAAVTKDAGISWCTAHTLRHTFASLLVQSGVSLYKVSQWLGHQSVQTSTIYSHLQPVDADIDKL